MKESVNWKNDPPQNIYISAQTYTEGLHYMEETVGRLDMNLNRALEGINSKKDHKITFKEMIAKYFPKNLKDIN